MCVSPVFPWVLSPNLQASWGPLRAPHQVPPREGSPDLPTHPGRCPWQGHRDEPAPSPEHGRSLGAITNPRRSFQNTHLVPGTSSPEALGKIRGAGPGSLGPAPPADQAPCPQTPALVGGDGRRASPLAWGLVWAPLHVQQRAEPLGVQPVVRPGSESSWPTVPGRPFSVKREGAGRGHLLPEDKSRVWAGPQRATPSSRLQPRRPSSRWGGLTLPTTRSASPSALPRDEPSHVGLSLPCGNSYGLSCSFLPLKGQ